MRSLPVPALPIVGLVLVLSCGPEAPPVDDPPREPVTTTLALSDAFAPNAARDRASVVLLTLDTTRADHLGVYGAAGDPTPHLDALAERGIRFDQAISPVPMTLPAHASILTGQEPPEHGVRINGEMVLPESATTLAERLGEAGYETAAFVSSFVLDPRFGIAQGFDIYDADLPGTATERSARATTDAALAWLGARSAEQPFFLWVHYFDPHDPYEPPDDFRRRFPGDPYTAEIAAMDAQIGRLLQAIDPDGTLVVAVADHGESLGEHGELYHSKTVYEGAIRVPWIMAGPGVTASGGVVGEPAVSLVDLMPTVLGLLTGDSGASGNGGRGLLDLEPSPERAVYAETLSTYLENGWAPLHAARTAHAKYILAPQPELYDLTTDPDESSNLLPGAEERAAPLVAFVETRLDDGGAQAAATETAQPDAETLARLQSLGYLTGGGLAGESAQRDPMSLPDPKDVLPLLPRLDEGRRLLAQGQPREAERRARELLAVSPDDRSALHLLGESYAVQGRLDEAERALRRYLDLRPDPTVASLLAQILGGQQRFDEAEALVDLALDLDPDHGPAWVARGDLAVFQGRPAEAVERYRHAAEIDPSRAGAVARDRLARLEALRAN